MDDVEDDGNGEEDDDNKVGDKQRCESNICPQRYDTSSPAEAATTMQQVKERRQ